jgi:hypothetical protein
VVECTDLSFACLIINCNSTHEILKTFPRTRKCSKLSGEFYDVRLCESRNQMLQAQLRLAHIKDGEKEISHICAEYIDVLNYPVTSWQQR